MCLFFGAMSEECQHAECQIVSTIRGLNQSNIFKQVATQHTTHQLPPPESMLSISHPEDHPSQPSFKVEEEVEGGNLREVGQREEALAGRVGQLEREVYELKSMVYWMKGKLEMRGVLQ